MTLDPELLERVRVETQRLAEAERQVLLARTECHTAVRRLHLAGASLREVADALGLSHQRVQQMVQGAGGSWWRRAWRSRNNPRDATCTWCGRPPSEVAKLVAGPNVYICDACLGRVEAAFGARTSASGSATTSAPGSASAPGPASASASLWRVAEGSPEKCSFCAKRARGPRALVAGTAANICGDCARLTRELMR